MERTWVSRALRAARAFGTALGDYYATRWWPAAAGILLAVVGVPAVWAAAGQGAAVRTDLPVLAMAALGGSAAVVLNRWHYARVRTLRKPRASEARGRAARLALRLLSPEAALAVWGAVFSLALHHDLSSGAAFAGAGLVPLPAPWGYLSWLVTTLAWAPLGLAAILLVFHHFREWTLLGVGAARLCAHEFPLAGGTEAYEAWEREWRVRLLVAKEHCETFFQGFLGMAFVVVLLVFGWAAITLRNHSLHPVSVAAALFGLALVAAYFAGPSWAVHRAIERTRGRALRVLERAVHGAGASPAAQHAFAELQRERLSAREGEPAAALLALGSFFAGVFSNLALGLG